MPSSITRFVDAIMKMIEFVHDAPRAKERREHRTGGVTARRRDDAEHEAFATDAAVVRPSWRVAVARERPLDETGQRESEDSGHQRDPQHRQGSRSPVATPVEKCERATTT